jgi:superfamily I DNA/RNA helicase
VGAGSKRVKQKYNDLLEKLGPELKILHEITYESLERSGIPLLSEAIKRVRAKQITLLPGYDGEFGKVKIFTQEEREKLSNQQSLFIYRPSKEKCNKKEGKKREKKGIESLKTEKPKERKQSKTEKKKDNDIISTLNKDQKKGVLHKKGPLMIIAGPGTGKTRTLTHRIAHLVKDKKVSPENILAVTFTNKAAQEMRERLEVLIKGVKKFPLIATFHSLCFKILQEQENIPKLSIIDDDERKILVLEAFKDIKKRGITINEKPQVFLDKVVYAKQQIVGPDDDIKDITGENNAESFSLFYRVYQNLLSTQKLCDFEDLIYMVVNLFEKNNRIRKKYMERFKFIFIDEYQDLNHGQYRIIKALAPPDGTNDNLCVIGDPDQSIYGFRGSDVKHFDHFTRDYSNAKVITLTKNYRSTETILEASYQIIKNRNTLGSAEAIKNSEKPDNFARRVYSRIEGLKKITILELLTGKAEAESISRAIEQMIGGTGHHSIDTGRVKEPYSIKERSFSDFAVLYRTKFQSQSIVDVFTKRGIPVQIVSKEKIFNKKNNKQIISLLKIIEGVGSYIDVERVNKILTPGISRQTVGIFKSWSKKSKFSLKKAVINSARFPLPEMSRQRQINFHVFMDSFSRLKKEMNGMTVEKKLLYIVEHTKLKTTAKNSPESKDAFNKLIDISKNHSKDTDEFFSAIALQTDTDTYYPQAEKVSLMTMHAAKGLEFPVVFITGCEKGYIPFERGEDKVSDINEERRLFYVAMTRAKERLYLTCAKKRIIFGKAVLRDLSPFVEDIEKRLRTHEAPVLKKKKKNRHVQLELF